LPMRAVRAGHRVLDASDGLPTMRPLRLALHRRNEASATVLALVERLVRRCEQLTAASD